MNNKSDTHDRRHFMGAVATTPLIAGACLTSASAVEPVKPNGGDPVRYCLNMSTINSSQIPLRQQLKIAADAGYTGVELWLRDVDKYLQEGGDLISLRREISDLGLTVESSIAFGKWIVDNEQERQAGLEQVRKDMGNLRALGGRRLAAPPVGVTDPKAGKLDLSAAGTRYRRLLEIGRQYDVLPQIELWGFSYNMSTLAEVLYVAAAADDPDACILLDVYHLYKGGSQFANMSLVPGGKMHVLHMNDYPADPPRSTIKDEHRVYPGDGVAPMAEILSTLMRGGFHGVLSLELFNREYWKQPAADVAKRGLEKMRAAVDEAVKLVQN
ncbi:MAG: sugar phosphate isomerase/epimerase [Pirellulaceae bacterium]|nr:sugar phosphate isomerase/epimerase [Pirellulaceae bacterium]